MKFSIKKLPILLISLLLCTACFDLQENLFLKKDGSGTFSFVIDMAEMKSMMAMFDDMNLDELGENSKTNDRKSKKKENKFDSNFEITKRKLLNTEGITNVKTIEDTVNFKFGLSFDFKTIASLNKAMNRLFEDEEANDSIPKTDIVYFELKDNQLIRNDYIDSKSIIGKSGNMSKTGTGNNDIFSSLTANLEQLFANVSYSTNYEFERKISQSTNQQSMLSNNLKKVTIKCNPFVAAKDSNALKCSIANTISF